MEFWNDGVMELWNDGVLEKWSDGNRIGLLCFISDTNMRRFVKNILQI